MFKLLLFLSYFLFLFQIIKPNPLNLLKSAVQKITHVEKPFSFFGKNFLNKRSDDGTQTKTNADSESSGSSGSGSSSGSLSESQSLTKTRVKTKIRASSNAKSNSTAASKAKAFAKTNTLSKVNTNLGVKNTKSQPSQEKSSSPTPKPYPSYKNKSTTPKALTRPTHAYWSPSFVTTVSPKPISANNSYSNTNSVTNSPSSKTNIVCLPCPFPCPYPIPCPCKCPVSANHPTIVFCPIQCPSPPPPPPQNYPQPLNIVPCSPGTIPCNNIPEICHCDVINSYCPCKRTIRSKIIGQAENHSGITQVEIFSSHNFTYQHAAVAADHYKCSEMGKKILEKGGSAMDAAITVHLCVEIVNPHSTGLGGENVTTIDFREKLPLNQEMTQGDTILVPGVLKGLELGHKLMGKLPWKELFKEPIELAKNGYIMAEALSAALSRKKDYVFANLGLKEVFAPEGFLLKEGHRVKRAQLAKTYKKIADSGNSDIFYKGEFAMEIVQDVREAGGSMTLDDLKNYEAIVKDPIEAKFDKYKIYGVKPPASSATVIMMLKLMKKFGWTKNFLRENPGLFYHQMVEAFKYAYAPTTFFGDPKFDKDNEKVIKYMLDDKVINKIFKRIDNVSHPVDHYGKYSNHPFEFTGTSHISILGPDGDAVSLTSSINAQLLSRKLGFIYNNELSDFTEFWPKVYNFTKDSKIPGKRPMSKVAPLIMTNEKGEVEIVIGAAGGFFIPTALASTLSFYLLLHDNITTAVSRPRIHCQLFPPTVVIEDTFPQSIIPMLNQYSHQYVTNDTFSASGQSAAIMGVIQAIVKNPSGTYDAVCDYRKGGLPAGF